MVSRPTDTSFDDIADTELLRNFFEVAGNASLILHHGRAADYLQILDLGQTREQLFLNSISKEGVLFFLAQIIQRKNRNAFVGNGYSNCSGFRRHPMRQKPKASNGSGNYH